MNQDKSARIRIFSAFLLAATEMLDGLVDWWIDRRVRRERQSLPRIDWEALVSGIQSEMEGYTVFLETRDRRFVPPASIDENADVVGVALAWIREGVKPWDMEEPARRLKERLSRRGDIVPVMLLSRSIDSFAGYYVSVRPAGPSS